MQVYSKIPSSSLIAIITHSFQYNVIVLIEHQQHIIMSSVGMMLNRQ